MELNKTIFEMDGDKFEEHREIFCLLTVYDEECPYINDHTKKCINCENSEIIEILNHIGNAYDD